MNSRTRSNQELLNELKTTAVTLARNCHRDWLSARLNLDYFTAEEQADETIKATVPFGKNSITLSAATFYPARNHYCPLFDILYATSTTTEAPSTLLLSSILNALERTLEQLEHANAKIAKKNSLLAKPPIQLPEFSDWHIEREKPIRRKDWSKARDYGDIPESDEEYQDSSIEGYQAWTNWEHKKEAAQREKARLFIEHTNEALKYQSALQSFITPLEQAIAIQTKNEATALMTKKTEKLQLLNANAPALLTGLMDKINRIKAALDTRIAAESTALLFAPFSKTDPARKQEIDLLTETIQSIITSDTDPAVSFKKAYKEIISTYRSIRESSRGEKSTTAAALKDILDSNQKIAQDYLTHISDHPAKSNDKHQPDDILHLLKHTATLLVNTLGNQAGQGTKEILNILNDEESTAIHKIANIQYIANDRLSKKDWLGNPLKRHPEIQAFYFYIKKSEWLKLKKWAPSANTHDAPSIKQQPAL